MKVEKSYAVFWKNLLLEKKVSTHSRFEALDPYPPNKQRTDFSTLVVLSGSSSVTYILNLLNISMMLNKNKIWCYWVGLTISARFNPVLFGGKWQDSYLIWIILNNFIISFCSHIAVHCYTSISKDLQIWYVFEGYLKRNIEKSYQFSDCLNLLFQSMKMNLIFCLAHNVIMPSFRVKLCDAFSKTCLI